MDVVPTVFLLRFSLLAEGPRPLARTQRDDYTKKQKTKPAEIAAGDALVEVNSEHLNDGMKNEVYERACRKTQAL